jgi:hypothetical protein
MSIDFNSHTKIYIKHIRLTTRTNQERNNGGPMSLLTVIVGPSSLSCTLVVAISVVATR